jgi:hypothetical protein
LFLLFDSGIQIFYMNSSLTFANSINFVTGNPPSTIYSMDSHNDLLAYAVGDMVKVLNISSISNIQQILYFNATTIINDICVRYPYLIIATNNTIQQYDINLKAVVSKFANTTTNYRMSLIDYDIIHMYQDYPAIYSNFSAFRYNSIVSSNNGSCL